MSDEAILRIYQQFLHDVVPNIRAANSILRYANIEKLQRHPNPLALCGAKLFSQSEEDGITFEILRRIGIDQGVFAEFGVGNGLENNTLALVAAGWNGFWIGAQQLAFEHNPLNSQNLNFFYKMNWITLENILDLYHEGLGNIRQNKTNVISLDLDGNDYYFCEKILSNIALPDVFIVEYNANFMPPIKFKIDYDEGHQWMANDYYGASLSSFVDLFEKYGYFLTYCTLCGTNAFFVRTQYRDRFADLPTRIEQLYSPPRYWLIGLDSTGHTVSEKTIKSIFSKINPKDEPT